MVLRWVIAGLVVLHGLLHLLGFVKAFRFAELSALQRPISRPMGLLWLTSAVVLIAAGGAAVFSAANFPALALVGVALSQTAIVAAWSDAGWGTAANVVVLAAAAWFQLLGAP